MTPHTLFTHSPHANRSRDRTHTHAHRKIAPKSIIHNPEGSTLRTPPRTHAHTYISAGGANSTRLTSTFNNTISCQSASGAQAGQTQCSIIIAVETFFFFHSPKGAQSLFALHWSGRSGGTMPAEDRCHRPFAVVLLVVAVVASHCAHVNAQAKRNVLLVIADDMRPQTNAVYNASQMITPNFDRLLGSSHAFRKAYVQIAICGPSRNSFLSGRRPQKTLVWNFDDSFRDAPGGEDWQSLPGLFKDNGYFVQGAGKVFHSGSPPHNDGAASWTEPDLFKDFPNEHKCASDFFELGNESESSGEKPAAFTAKDESMVCPDRQPYTEFADYKNQQNVLEKLRNASANYDESGTPFFLALGFHKPHAPFRFPVAFPGFDDVWEAYGPTEDIVLPKFQHVPEGMPAIAMPYSMDGLISPYVFDTQYPVTAASTGCPRCSVRWPQNVTRTLRKGYYAAVTWVDYLLGGVLDEIDALGRTNDTVIAWLGDHGWSLGEHNMWSKQSNFEVATRIPFGFREAGQTEGRVYDQVVEAVDLYPTLATLAGLEISTDDLDGEDLVPLMMLQPRNATATTSEESGAAWSGRMAYSEFPKCGSPDTPWDDFGLCTHKNRYDFTAIGYSVRSQRWRCTQHYWWDSVNLAGNFSRPAISVELYSHHASAGTNGSDDFNSFDATENVNVAADFPEIVQRFTVLMRQHWGNHTAPLRPTTTGDATTAAGHLNSRASAISASASSTPTRTGATTAPADFSSEPRSQTSLSEWTTTLYPATTFATELPVASTTATGSPVNSTAFTAAAVGTTTPPAASSHNTSSPIENTGTETRRSTSWTYARSTPASATLSSRASETTIATLPGAATASAATTAPGPATEPPPTQTLRTTAWTSQASMQPQQSSSAVMAHSTTSEGPVVAIGQADLALYGSVGAAGLVVLIAAVVIAVVVASRKRRTKSTGPYQGSAQTHSQSRATTTFTTM